MASSAGLIFKQNLSFNSEAQKLFSKREWQNAMKASLIDAGRDWIAGALPKRFTSFAVSLGYSSKKLTKPLTREEKIRLAISLMRTNGMYDKIVKAATAPWGGWDPTGKAAPSGEVWRKWSSEALKAGKIKASNSGEWRTARQKMRKEVIQLSRLREKVRNYAIDEYVDADKGVEPIPLVDTGDLEKYAMANARPDAKARGGNTELAIRIPRPHPLRGKESDVLSKATDGETQRVADIFTAQMESFVAGSSVTGKTKKKLTASKIQKRAIQSKIRGAMKQSVRNKTAHKNRRQPAHESRS